MSSFEILRQGDWDVWSWVCIAGAMLLLGRLFMVRLGQAAPGAGSLLLSAIGVLGTAVVLTVPALRSARVGLAWTFLLLTIVSAVSYLGLLDRLSPRRTAVLLSLRIIALAALVPMLFAPVLRLARSPLPQRPVLFLIDTSGSMSFPDVQNGPPRLRTTSEALQRLLPSIRQRFVPQFFTFSTDLTPIAKAEDIAQQPADGKATDLVTAVTKALGHTSREDAAVVLISDGIDNVNADPAEALSALGHPVYTVRVGSDAAEMAPLANVAVSDLQPDQDFVVGHESQITATIRSSALPDRVIDVNLAELDADGKPIGPPVSKKLILQPTPDGQKVKLPYTPASAGVHRLAVWVDPVAGERSVADNRQEFAALALDPSIRVLYIEGRLRPEYRELKRLLEHDPNVELATLLWVTPAKVAAFGTNQRQPMQASLPDSPEQWKRFDVVILGDLPSARLSAAQQSQLERFVADGGALLMLGGQESFAAGNYKGTPIEKALPVTVGDSPGALDTEPFVPRLTADGAAHPAMQGLGDWFGTAQAPPSRALPPLNGNLMVASEKSGAQVLLMRPDRNAPNGQPQIVLAVQRYGKGRSAALTVYSTYQWALPLYGLGQESPYNRLWGQLVRWLGGADVRNRRSGPGLDVLLSKNVYRLGENIRIRAQVRDSHGDATRYAQVSVAITSPDARTPQTLPLAPDASQPGLYDLVLPHLPRGDYTATLIASKDGNELGRRAVKFSVIPPADEFLKIAADPALLRHIAERTHAASYDLAQLPDLVEELTRTDTRTPRSQTVSVRLANFACVLSALVGHFPDLPQHYDLPIQALLVLPLLAAEWALRRRWQLA